jgi:two-component system OmpR family sensor kinase
MKVVPTSLNGRLVAAAVGLVAVVGLLVCLTTTLAMRHYLTSQLDAQVENAAQHTLDLSRGDQLPPPSADGGVVRFRPGQQVGILAAYFIPNMAPYGQTITSTFTEPRLSSKALALIGKIPADNSVHQVELPGIGAYRVEAVTVNTNLGKATIVTGLPAHDIDSTLSSLLWWQLLLTVCGVAVAAAVGDVLVRRTLRPLRQVAQTAHEVAEQQLSSGETTIDTRVPEQLTNPDTEVGAVGSALNTMLDHVDSALASRHRSEQQLRQFLADASHELRTPLATIHGYAELSHRTPDDSEALSIAMGKVETEAHRMSRLVEDMLLLARLDAGRPLEREEVDLTRLLLEAVADARVVAPDHHWRLQLPDEPVTVTGDEQRLHQVVTNLLGNARRHTPPGTTVTVSASGVDRKQIVVHDDGPGLSDGLAAHVFERFTRGDTSRTRDSGGAGLGLSLVSAISEAHGGTAAVNSRPGSTTFTVTLPNE